MREEINHFEKLTPVKSIEKMETYQKVLDFAFKESDILNIAVTGPYSAGKSSVINTYEKLNPKKKFMYVSLARFDNPDDSHGNENVSEMEIEGKILNQIIHQINPEKVPQTNFKIKTKVSFTKVILTTLFMILLMSMLFYLLFFKVWSKHVSALSEGNLKSILFLSTSNDFYFYTLVAFIILMGVGLYYLVKAQLERPFLKKIKVEKYEIEIFESEKDSSYFDKHLDDILYLFRNSDQHAFIFEDIDRYNMNIIFSKLREINILINKNTTGKIRFIYLLRDDIFTSKDRTKFFDLLIPVVPVIDSSNSYDKIIKTFKKGRILEDFESTFLERLSLYIDDMRILKNIYNEYVIYHESIQGTELKTDKLLAMITYKNLFPKDFSSLQYNNGHVYRLFLKKEEFIKKVSEELNTKLENNIILIKKVEEETLTTVDELDALYLNAVSNYSVDGNYDYNYKTRSEFINALRKSPNNVTNQRGFGVDIESEFEKLSKIPEYVRRKEIVEQKDKDKILLLQEENGSLKEEMKRTKSYKLSDLILREDTDEVFHDEQNEVTDSPYYDLIKYLVRQGYIDETYPDYLTYFWEQYLSRTDKIFLRSITDEKAKEFDYKMDKVERVVSRLKDSDFEQKEILNFYLLDYLLKEDHYFLPLFLKEIKETKHFTFVFDYIDWSEDFGQFIKILNEQWASVGKDLLAEDAINETEKKKYIIETMYHSDIEDILVLNEAGCLTNYISLSDDFLEIESPKINSIIQSLAALNVRFQSIDYTKSNKELFVEVYRRNLYQLSFKLIESMLFNIHQEANSQKLRQENYTIINTMPEDEPIRLYIEENINNYIEIMLENVEGKINDSEKSVIRILNNEDIEKEFKSIYLNKLSTILTNIQDIKESYWEDVIQSKNLKHTIENALNYFITYAGEIDSTLIGYLNSSEDLKFDFEGLKDDFKEDKLFNFFHEIAGKNELDNVIYGMVLKESNMTLIQFNFKEIEEDKLKILIDLGIIQMNLDNLVFIREALEDQTLFFISRNVIGYTEILNEEIKDEKELLLLLEEPTITIGEQLELLKHFTSNISLQSKTYPNEIEVYILKHCFDESDLEYVINNYTTASTSVQKATEDVVVSHIDKVINKIKIESKELLNEILQSTELDIDRKMELLYPVLSYFSKEVVVDFLATLNLDELLSVFDGKRPRIKKDELIHKYLTYFKEKDWISSFTEDANDSGFYRAIGKVQPVHK